MKTIIPTFVTMLVFIFGVSIQTVNVSSNTSTGIDIPNATLPEIDYSYENDEEGRNTQAQSCRMPPCPPGEMCIQVCPESVPE